MNFNININKGGITDKDIDNLLNAFEVIDYDDIINLCDGNEMLFGDWNIKIQDNKDYQPMVISYRDNKLKENK